jgi:hypothetical protein
MLESERLQKYKEDTEKYINHAVKLTYGLIQSEAKIEPEFRLTLLKAIIDKTYDLDCTVQPKLPILLMHSKKIIEEQLQIVVINRDNEEAENETTN